jgi:hypothetical protein
MYDRLNVMDSILVVIGVSIEISHAHDIKRQLAHVKTISRFVILFRIRPRSVCGLLGHLYQYFPELHPGFCYRTSGDRNLHHGLF